MITVCVKYKDLSTFQLGIITFYYSSEILIFVNRNAYYSDENMLSNNIAETSSEVLICETNQANYPISWNSSSQDRAVSQLE